MHLHAIPPYKVQKSRLLATLCGAHGAANGRLGEPEGTKSRQPEDINRITSVAAELSPKESAVKGCKCICTTRIIFVVFRVFCLHHLGAMFQNMLRSHTAHAASISQASPVHTSAASTTSNASPGPPSDHCCREAPRPLVLPECPVQSLSPNS